MGKHYSKFWNCKKRYRVLKGGKASKKSTTAALWYIYHLMKYPDANLLVVRQVAATHISSTFSQLRWAIDKLEVGHLWEYRTSPVPYITYVPTGQQIIFRGMDDVYKLASVTVQRGYLCWVWIEEAFEIQSMSDFDKLDLTVPRGNVCLPVFKQTTLTFNPWNAQHWLKSRFFDKPYNNVLALTRTYKHNEFLDHADKEIYDTMKLQNPRQYQVAGLGNWGVAEGLVYNRWSVKNFRQDLLFSWEFLHVFGLDYGYTNDPTAFIAMAVDGVGKVIYVYDEFYQKRMHNNEIAQKIQQMGYAKERIRADSAEPKSNDDLRRHGIRRIIPAAKGPDSVRNGISLVGEYEIVIHPRCKNFLREISQFIYRLGGSGKTSGADHLMDAMRYAMEDIKSFRPKPDHDKLSKNKLLGGLSKGGSGIVPEDFKNNWI